MNKCYATELEAFKAYENKYGITRNDYYLITGAFNNLLMESVIETGNAYTLPSGLGTFVILKKRPPDKAKFEYKLYKETGQKIWTKNLHSDGQVAVYIWNNRRSNSTISPMIKSVWNWDATREFKRLLAKKIINDNYINKYYDIYDY